MMRKCVLQATVSTVAALLTTPVLASDYPVKPVTVIMPFPAGSLTDNIARLVTSKLQQKWGQPFIIENRAGAAGNIGAEAVARAAPDGYTLLLTPTPPLVINQSLYSRLSYDPERFEPISTIVTWPNVLLTHPSLKVNSVQALLDHAKAHPGKINYASNGNGTTPHLTAELFKSITGIDIVHVPYKGAAPAMADLLDGQVNMAFIDLGSALPYIRSGRLQALAVTGPERNDALPDVPSMAELLPGFQSIAWAGAVAPPGTPKDITRKLSEAMAEVIQAPDVAARFRELTLTPVGSTPEAMDRMLKEERARWGEVIRTSGSKVD